MSDQQFVIKLRKFLTEKENRLLDAGLAKQPDDLHAATIASFVSAALRGSTIYKVYTAEHAA